MVILVESYAVVADFVTTADHHGQLDMVGGLGGGGVSRGSDGWRTCAKLQV